MERQVWRCVSACVPEHHPRRGVYARSGDDQRAGAGECEQYEDGGVLWGVRHVAEETKEETGGLFVVQGVADFFA